MISMDRYSEPRVIRSLGLFFPAFLTTLLVALVVVPARADKPDVTGLFSDFSLDDFDSATNALQTDDPADLTASYRPGANEGEIEIRVDVTLQPKWHLYSTTQPKGGPKPTKLSLADSQSVSIAGEWKSDREPLRSVSQDFGGITVEEFEDKVTFTATAKLTDQTTSISELGDLEIRVDALACMTGGACMPVKETLTAKFVGETKAGNSPVMVSANAKDPASLKAHPVNLKKTFRDEDYVVRWEAINLTPNLQPGQTGLLRFTAIPDAGYHVYTSAVDDEQSKTNFVVSEKSGLMVGAPQTKSAPIDYDLLPGVTYHKGNVTWTLPVAIPSDAEAGEHKLVGGIAYQACTDDSCQQPKAFEFQTVVNVVEEATASDSPVVMQVAAKKRVLVLDDAATIQWVDPQANAALNAQSQPKTDALPSATEPAQAIADAGDASQSEEAIAAATTKAAAEVADASVGPDAEEMQKSNGFGATLLFAFIGGVILNFMPCVLPVVGLKVMSFVQQAGEDRKRIFLLNLVYAVGILSVFAVLTALAVALSFNWGQQFTYFPVRLGLTLLMFAMALSYLGVWEIPVPGMAAGKTSQSLQQREGYTGAYFKGVFATVLATPCSGPLLGGILGLTFALTSLQTTAVIMTVGIGMALPYLLIGIWPALVAWLPKPGTWMETLKEFLAFLFLGTVAFFFNQFSDDHKLPVFVALIGVWFGCWMIGKVPNWGSLTSRLYAWAGGVVSAVVIGVAAFSWLGPAPEPAEGVKTIAWQPYDEAKLQQLQAEGRTVMIDFTAKWCVNCIVNYNVALNTEPTRQLIEELDAVPMLADWTDQDEEIEAKLKELQSRSIPILAIYPGKSPEEPIVLRDLVSQQMVLDALKEAGPSQTTGASKLARQPAKQSSPSGAEAAMASVGMASR
ncbi:protein-disulfide reductase DsbD family protein [Rhodopirellula halodulae]|uniref:protein-disulfide reductase DsbD family protein n=1 Tax=Rhodopirellula halodulae TaxID=2894198 RepID=UPI0036F2C07F